MSVSAVGSVRSLTHESQVFCINDARGNQPGESIIFVNGIMNELISVKPSRSEQGGVPSLEFEGAKVSAERISSLINSQRVVLFYNPTFCLSHQEITVGENRISQLFPLLAELIVSEHRRCSMNLGEGHIIRILVIAHSHGAFLTYEALNRVDDAVRRNVEVATFGGAKLIPSGLARKVQNFIYENDIVSILAQVNPKPGNLFIDFCVEQRKELLGIKSGADQSDRLISAIATHAKIKQGNHPRVAQVQTLMENFAKIIETASTLSENQRLEYACVHGLRAFILELGYSVEILTPGPSSQSIPHEFNTYYLPKAVEVIGLRG